MLDYELCKKLKEAGLKPIWEDPNYCQSCQYLEYWEDDETFWNTMERPIEKEDFETAVYSPIFSELIDSLGKVQDFILERTFVGGSTNTRWKAIFKVREENVMEYVGVSFNSPEEAVAELFLAMNSK